MSKDPKSEESHRSRIEHYALKVQRLYESAIFELALLAKSIKSKNKDKVFSFSDYPQTNKKLKDILDNFANNLLVTINKGTTEEWYEASKKKDTKRPEKDVYKARNKEALKAFQNRADAGITLSDRVWKNTEQMQQEVELALSTGILEGKSAAEIARSIQSQLKEPNKLFRRVRDEFGVLQLSKKALAYSPGQGVYRSSYKNALRLTRTEINMAYRASDHYRWQNDPSVVGFEVRLSNRHVVRDICDDLKGKYPKDFLFRGWHPNCYSDDTEVLTSRGWRLFKDLFNDDLIFSLNPETKIPEYVRIDVFMRRYYEGEMIKFANKNLDILVTPDHPMKYLKKDGSSMFAEIKAKDYSKNNGAIYRSSQYIAPKIEKFSVGNRLIDFNLFCEFMAYYLSEGSLSWTRKNQFFIAQSKEKSSEQYRNILNLLEKLPFKFSEVSTGFYMRDAEMYEYLKQFGKSENKHIPSCILNSSVEQISIFLDAYVKCDGHTRKPRPSFIGNQGTLFTPKKDTRAFFSSSNQMAADLGEMLVKIGRRPSYKLQKREGVEVVHKNGTYKGNKDLWVISECYSETATVFNKSSEPYSGYVYDVQLERNHIMYLRRNGKCFWGSNCLCYKVPIIMDDKDYNVVQKAILSGEDIPKDFKASNQVDDLPKGFKEWVRNNTEKSNGWKSQPYFIKDNFKNGKLSGGLKSSLSSANLDKIERFTLTNSVLKELKKSNNIDFEGNIDVYNKIIEGFDLKTFDDEVTAIFKEVGLNFEQKVVRAKGDRVNFTFYTPSKVRGVNSLYLERSFFFENGVKTVEHDYFQITEGFQGGGISKKLFRSLYKQYQNADIEKMKVHANLDVGGYTWAKYGFSTTYEGRIAKVIEKAKDKLKGKNLIDFQKWLEEGRAKEFFSMSELARRKYGKELLLGSDWFGFINLKDKNQRKTFETYLFSK
jgi:hypothetical protein